MKRTKSSPNIPFALKTLTYARLVDTQFNPLHRHIEWEFILPISGDVTHCINGWSERLLPGQILLSRPHDLHEIRNNSDREYSHYDVYMSNDSMKKICDFISPNIYPVMSRIEHFKPVNVSDEFRLALFDDINELLPLQQVSPVSPDTIALYDSVLFSLVGRFVRNQLSKDDSAPKWLKQLLVTINSAAYMDKSIDDIVATTYYTHGRLCSLFKKYMGCTLITYVTSVRMEYARELMRDESLSILDICERVGYSSLSHFTRLFNAHYGKTPGQYRKNMLSSGKPAAF